MERKEWSLDDDDGLGNLVENPQKKLRIHNGNIIERRNSSALLTLWYC
jgi:hypothetical protein